MKSRTSASDGQPLTGRGVRAADPGLELDDDEPEFWMPQAHADAEVDDPPSAAANSGGAAASIKSAGGDTVGRSLPWRLRSRGRFATAVALVLVAVAALYGLCALGPVRTVLRQSFSQINSPSPQFYLNGDPWISGQFLNVPLGMIVQNSPNTAHYNIRVWTLDRAGKTDASTTVTLAIQSGKGTGNFRLPVPVDAQLVWAQVENTSLSVHYRFAGSALPSITTGASAGGSH